MYVMHCTDQRKRSLPDIQDLVATIDLDENGNMKLTSKLVQCFFFFWDLGLFLASDAVCDQMLNATADPINEIHTCSAPILTPWSNTWMSQDIPRKVLVLRPLCFEEVND